MAFTIDRQEILNVATRNKQKDVSSYLESKLNNDAANAKIEAAVESMGKAFDKFSKLMDGSSSNELSPTKLSTTQIKLTNKAGAYVQFDGSGFKFSSKGDLESKLANFGTALASLAADGATTLKSISFGTKSGVVAKLEIKSTEIKLTVGDEVVSIKGDFPTKLSQVYKIIKETTGLDSKTGFDVEKIKLLALKSGSELSKLDIDSISLTSEKAKLFEMTLSDKVIKVTSGKMVVETKGHFPDNAGELYTAMREMLEVDKDSGTIVSFAKAIGKSASLHDYEVDSISIKSNGKTVGSATFTTKAVTLQIGDYKLTANGSFPHSAADFAQLIIDAEAGKDSNIKLTSLKLVDLKDGSVLASASGSLSGEDVLNIIDSVGGSFFGSPYMDGTSGSDKLFGSTQDDDIFGGAGSDELRGRGGDDYLDGGSGADTIYGHSGDDDMFGGANTDSLFGGSGDDWLDGGSAGDKLQGDAGADFLTGGAGADTFVYVSIGDSTVAAAGRDLILDFSQLEKDRIDLSAIDASTKTAKDQAFTFVGDSAFSKKAGELRFEFKDGDTHVSGDTNGDGKADFTIVLNNTHTLVAADFIL